MKPIPVPPCTPENFAGAIADLIRSAAVWGADAKEKEPDERVYMLVCQYTAQLYALVKRSDPTDAELTMVFQQLGGQSPT